jgi:NAD(P)-dependent dehydrogenase (short-subunit alcohol dehydrogenase family)
MNRPSKKAVDLHPIGRLGTSDEIAHAVTFLLSEGSSFFVGTQLIADGGYTAR